jgi:septation ring formation regulator EzrA
LSRQQKTPRQRAEETLAAAKRRVARLEKQTKAAEQAYSALVAELAQAEARLDYAHQDPALKQGTSTTTSSTTKQAGATA